MLAKGPSMRNPPSVTLALAVGLVLTVESPSADARPANARSIQTLGLDESVELTIQSDGCFHSVEYVIAIDGRSTNIARVDQGSRLSEHARVVTLSSVDLSGLDALLGFYRGLRDEGRCTTVDEIRVRWYRRGRQVRGEHFVDASCDASRVPGAVAIDTIARRALGR